jgi:hypothetical protein
MGKPGVFQPSAEDISQPAPNAASIVATVVVDRVCPGNLG